MQVTFYINTSPSIKVNKNLQVAITRDCDIIGQVDVCNPAIIVTGNVPSEYNYMHIGEPLNRYYFITAIDYTIAHKVVVTGHVDVLRTYHGFIEQTTLNYVRGAGDINEMDDSSYPLGDYVKQLTYAMNGWNSSFLKNEAGDNARHFILRVAAGRDVGQGEEVYLTVGQFFILEDEGGTNLFRVDLDTSATPPAPSITWISSSSSTAYQWVNGDDTVEILDDTQSSLGTYKFMNQGQFAYIVPA